MALNLAEKTPSGYMPIHPVREALDSLKLISEGKPGMVYVEQLESWLSASVPPVPALTVPAYLAEMINEFAQTLAGLQPDTADAIVRDYAQILFRYSAAVLCGVKLEP